jgi:hypothetical protein
MKTICVFSYDEQYELMLDYMYYDNKNIFLINNFTDNESYKIPFGRGGHDGLHDRERTKQGGAEVDEKQGVDGRFQRCQAP